MDATFRAVNWSFSKLFSIHAFVRSGVSMKQIPLVFCIMSGKRQKVLMAIDRRLPESINLESFVVDFDAAVWQAIRERFGDQYNIQGCAFHWSQALFRKIQELSLQKAYTEHNSVFSFLRQVMALNFLLPEQIRPAFEKLDNKRWPTGRTHDVPRSR
ncbi:uncharacterized protein [Argopecten irradians]|uniref:uncharacterized protein n=1 Tax=Argopecten irradians TaxID=31199 RepID=UPI0037232C23